MVFHVFFGCATVWTFVNLVYSTDSQSMLDICDPNVQEQIPKHVEVPVREHIHEARLGVAVAEEGAFSL